ncbi:MAG: glycosyltransferase [Candidatus Aenigmatarchaeota archaeon]
MNLTSDEHEETKPIVTIGVCVRNGAATLREAIESIMSQNYPHELMEIIFVDDGSTDDTLSIINDYASKMDIKVKIFHHEWKGLGYSRNVVVDNAEGKYIIWVDGDMILPTDHVRKQVKFMEQNPQVGIGKAKYGFMRGENLVATLENLPYIVLDAKNESLYSKLPGTGGAIFRVEAIRKVGGFDNRISGAGEDLDIAYRLKVAGWHIERSHAYFYERRVRTWRDLWRKHFWYGYGLFQIYRKDRRVFSPFRMNPLASFVAGILFALEGYKLTGCKSVFMLIFHYAFKSIAWYFGFIKAQINS